MQGEVIKNLQMAAQFENAVINFTLLHEASILNRKDTIVTLDELKQRLLIRMPIQRQLEGGNNSSQSNGAFLHSFQANEASNASPSNLMSRDYAPPAVTLSARQDMSYSQHGLDDHFRRSSNTGAANHSGQSRQPADINYSPAYQYLMDNR